MRTSKGELLCKRRMEAEYNFRRKITMKKVLALVLSVMMVLSLSVVAFAATEEKATGTPGGTSTPDSNDPS